MRASHIVALVSVLALAFVLSSPFSSGQQPQLAGINCGWPPRPTAMFNFCGFDVIDQGGDTTAPGQSDVTLLTVPSDRWLVITNIFSATNSASGLRVVERKNGSETVKALVPSASVSIGGTGPIGFVFEPGADVLLRNSYAVDANYAGVTLQGYFMRL